MKKKIYKLPKTKKNPPQTPHNAEVKYIRPPPKFSILKLGSYEISLSEKNTKT